MSINSLLFAQSIFNPMVTCWP